MCVYKCIHTVIVVKSLGRSCRKFPSIYFSLYILRTPNISIPLSHPRHLTWAQYYQICMHAHISSAVLAMSFPL